VLAMLFFPDGVRADSWRTITRIVREAADVGDEIPLRRLDELKSLPKRARLVEEILEQRIGKRLLAEADEARHLDNLWREFLGPSQKGLLQEVKTLPIGEQRLACALSVGAKELKGAVPDLTFRRGLIQRGGPETLLAVGRYPDLTDDALRFDAAVRTGRLLPPPGAQALETADFGRFFEKTGQQGYSFWTKYVRPYWGLWVGSAALAAVMLTPEEYLDEFGNLTEVGFAKLGRFASKTLLEALGGTTRGAIEGTGQALTRTIESTGNALVTTFLSGWSGVVALAILLALVVLLVKPLRSLVFSVCWAVYRGSFARKPPLAHNAEARKEG
jgi:hypothetical protein